MSARTTATYAAPQFGIVHVLGFVAAAFVAVTAVVFFAYMLSGGNVEDTFATTAGALATAGALVLAFVIAVYYVIDGATSRNG